MKSKRSGAGADGILLRRHMPELDTLRGIAILSVLLLHGFGWRFDPDSYQGLERLFLKVTTYGWVGVQLFFVLSGFLITGILLDSRGQAQYYRRFYIRRALRILPAYYGLLLFLLAFGRSRLFHGNHVEVPFLIGSLFYLSNLTPLAGIAIQYSFLWSLAVEEHFYLLWPFIVRRINKRQLTAAAIAIVALSPVARFCGLHFGNIANENFYTWCNLDGLALGALIALLFRKPGVQRREIWTISLVAGSISSISFITMARLGLLAWTSGWGFALRLSVLDLAFASLLLLTLLIGSGAKKFLVNVRWLQFLGEISYGLYLYHMLFFLAFHVLAEKWGGHWNLLRPTFGIIVAQFILCGAASIAFAAASRFYFEAYFLLLKERLTAMPEKQQSRDTETRIAEFSKEALSEQPA